MLKILVVLATTFVFAGLLIAHPYTSSSVDLASASAKVKPGPATAPVTVAQIEPSSQPARPAAQDAPVARPAAAAQARPIAPVVVPAVRQPAPAAPAAGKRTDGRHWSQADSQRMKADAVRAQADAMPRQTEVARPQVDAMTGQAPGSYRPRAQAEYNRR